MAALRADCVPLIVMVAELLDPLTKVIPEVVASVKVPVFEFVSVDIDKVTVKFVVSASKTLSLLPFAVLNVKVEFLTTP